MNREQLPLEERAVTTLRGVGPRLAARLERLGIHTVQDVLFHLPLRYQDRTRTVPIGALVAGQEAVVEAEVRLTEIGFGRRRALLCRIEDGTGLLTLRFFHFNARQREALAPGAVLRCFGQARAGPTGLEMIHPEYRVLGAGEGAAVEERLTPIYPATEGVHQLSLRRITEQALEALEEAGGDGLVDWLPAGILRRHQLPTLAAAVRFLHRPPPAADVAALEAGRHPAQRRLAFEELLAHHLSLRQLRHRVRRRDALALAGTGDLLRRFWGRLGFEPTAAQRRVIGEIHADLRNTHPMLRLVQGDVGSGKTVVAAAAALSAIESGAQVALMAPTELLAEQHLRSFEAWFEVLGVSTAWLVGRGPAGERRRAREDLGSGRASFAVGTHALFQEEVEFARLGLIVVDEQHRFGVHQRMALRDKGREGARLPHQLIMTATPIPRTLAMTAYADLDVSVIDELPPGRKPVQTVAVPHVRRPDVVARVERLCREGGQAYWVCTLIEESESLQCEAAEDTARELGRALPDLRVGLVHGRLKSGERATVMRAFVAGELDVLVATTVIEVGVDVANASLMVIENPERLGLAQLHQLRGRVGRGAAASHCVLLYRAPLSAAARERIAVMRATSDGFEIARKDLELRGPGEVLGTRQSGLLQLKVADLARDQDLIPEVAAAAEQLLEHHAASVPGLVRRWLGRAPRYASV